MNLLLFSGQVCDDGQPEKHAVDERPVRALWRPYPRHVRQGPHQVPQGVRGRPIKQLMCKRKKREFIQLLVTHPHFHSDLSCVFVKDIHAIYSR